MTLGTNVNAEVVGTILTITIDLSKTFGSSGSGKSTTVATTGGNKLVPNTTVHLGLNAYIKK